MDIINLLDTIGISAILAWYMWHTETKKLPRIEAHILNQRGEFMDGLADHHKSVGLLTLVVHSQLNKLINNGSPAPERTMILLVEDDPVDARNFEKRLLDRGTLNDYEFKHVMTVGQSVPLLDRAAFVVSDFKLPDCNTVGEHATLSRLDGAPFVIWSGADELIRQQLMATGIQAFGKDSESTEQLITYIELQLRSV